jgi:CO/xanthine dehydrogenase Mo-binding subunit
VHGAAGDARAQIIRLAAREFEAAADDVEIADGMVRVRGAPTRAMPLSDIGALTHNRTGAILGYGTATVAGHALPAGASLRGALHGSHQDITFGAVACELEVEPDTGQIRLLRVVAAHDVGTAINPQQVEAQIEGAAMQGVGYALTEEQVIEDGVVLNTLLSDYLVPTSVTAPPVESIIVEGYDPSGPFGGKGVGEHALLGVAPAVANAVYAATGARLRELPLSPQRVLAATCQPAATPV